MTSPEKLAKYLAYYKDQYQNSEKNWAQYDYEYTLLASAIETSNPIPLDVNAPCNCDIAYISADDTFQAMADAGYDMNVYFKNDADFDGSNFLKYLARNTNGGELDTDFGEIKAKLITGEMSFDQWDEIQTNIKNMGLDRYIEIYTQAALRIENAG